MDSETLDAHADARAYETESEDEQQTLLYEPTPEQQEEAEEEPEVDMNEHWKQQSMLFGKLRSNASSWRPEEPVAESSNEGPARQATKVYNPTPCAERTKSVSLDTDDDECDEEPQQKTAQVFSMQRSKAQSWVMPAPTTEDAETKNEAKTDRIFNQPAYNNLMERMFAYEVPVSEQPPAAPVAKQSSKGDFAARAARKPVLRKLPSVFALEEYVPMAAPVVTAAEEAPKAVVTEEAPKAAVTEEAPKAAVTEEAPKAVVSANVWMPEEVVIKQEKEDGSAAAQDDASDESWRSAKRFRATDASTERNARPKTEVKFIVYSTGERQFDPDVDSDDGATKTKRFDVAAHAKQHFRNLQNPSLYRYMKEGEDKMGSRVGSFGPSDSRQHTLILMPSNRLKFEKLTIVGNDYYVLKNKADPFIFDASLEDEYAKKNPDRSHRFFPYATAWHPSNHERAFESIYRLRNAPRGGY